MAYMEAAYKVHVNERYLHSVSFGLQIQVPLIAQLAYMEAAYKFHVNERYFHSFSFGLQIELPLIAHGLHGSCI